jgi:hypothetical protein
VFFKIQGWFREVVKDTRLLLLVWWSNKGGGVIRRDLLSHGMLGLYVGTSRRERNYQIQRVFIVESAAWPATWKLFDSMTENVEIWNQWKSPSCFPKPIPPLIYIKPNTVASTLLLVVLCPRSSTFNPPLLPTYKVTSFLSATNTLACPPL